MKSAADGRTESVSTDFSDRSQSFAGGQDDKEMPHIRGSIVRTDLKIDIPVDKKAEHNPEYKTPPAHDN